MPKYLRRWKGRQTRLTIGNKTFFGIVDVETLAPAARKSRNYEMSTERRYTFHTYDEKLIPIYSHGAHRVIEQNGGLVKLI